MKTVLKKTKPKPYKKVLKKYDGGGSVDYEVGKEVKGLEPKGYWDGLSNLGSDTKTLPKKEISKKSDGFKSDEQRNAYIKNAKNLISKGETISSLVKSKFGTASGLKALGIVDKPKTVKPAPVKEKLPVKKKVEVIKPPVKKKVEVIKPPVKSKKTPETEGQRLARIGKKQANSYKWSPERISKETKTGRVDTVVNTKQNGNKQTKVTTYNKKGDKLKTYYKETGPRLVLDSVGKRYLNSKGTKYTEITREGNKKVTKGKNLSMDPVKKGSLNKGSTIEKIAYKNLSGLTGVLDYSKKPIKLNKGGKIKTKK